MQPGIGQIALFVFCACLCVRRVCCLALRSPDASDGGNGWWCCFFTIGFKDKKKEIFVVVIVEHRDRYHAHCCHKIKNMIKKDCHKGTSTYNKIEIQMGHFSTDMIFHLCNIKNLRLFLQND